MCYMIQTRTPPTFKKHWTTAEKTILNRWCSWTFTQEELIMFSQPSATLRRNSENLLKNTLYWLAKTLWWFIYTNKSIILFTWNLNGSRRADVEWWLSVRLRKSRPKGLGGIWEKISMWRVWSGETSSRPVTSSPAIRLRSAQVILFSFWRKLSRIPRFILPGDLFLDLWKSFYLLKVYCWFDLPTSVCKEIVKIQYHKISIKVILKKLFFSD